jgi:cyclophilin family peptidyl-prolyl cis-trans isomerase
MQYYLRAITILVLIFLSACNEKPKQKKTLEQKNIKDSVAFTKEIIERAKKEEEEKPFLLTEENAIPFFFEYEKTHKQSKVKVFTSMGNFTIDLFKNTPYHRANFIYLSSKNYFNKTYFHRVVKDFIIQGGNTDLRVTASKRDSIGFYLLPPDVEKGHKHIRGTVSMPSSDEVTNPHKLASPFEFFIVTTKTGAPHLNGKFTAFGMVSSGMDVVDKINGVKTGEDEWPLKNVIIDSISILD